MKSHDVHVSIMVNWVPISCTAHMMEPTACGCATLLLAMPHHKVHSDMLGASSYLAMAGLCVLNKFEKLLACAQLVRAPPWREQVSCYTQVYKKYGKQLQRRQLGHTPAAAHSRVYGARLITGLSLKNASNLAHAAATGGSAATAPAAKKPAAQTVILIEQHSSRPLQWEDFVQPRSPRGHSNRAMSCLASASNLDYSKTMLEAARSDAEPSLLQPGEELACNRQGGAPMLDCQCADLLLALVGRSCG